MILRTSILLSFAFLLACQSAQEKQVSNAVMDTQKIIVTDQQYKAANITLGHVEQKQVSTLLQVNGKLDVPPQNMISISAPMGGFVKATAMLQGMKVKKGDVLATLENQEYIQLQQDYLDHLSQLHFLEADFNRQIVLAKENINAEKAYQQVKANYESRKAIVRGLEARLAMLNLEVPVSGNGKIKSTLHLYAPMAGYITAVNVNIGQFVNTTDVLFKLVNLDHTHAELQVFEQDINKIAAGQKVKFQLANEIGERHATVYLIGKEISAERTVQVHCHLDKEDERLLPGTFVTATIQIHTSLADVVPTKSLVSHDGKYFIFIEVSGNEFRAVEVRTGNEEDGFTAIQFVEPFSKDSRIVLTGAYELIGLLKNKEEE